MIKKTHTIPAWMWILVAVPVIAASFAGFNILHVHQQLEMTRSEVDSAIKAVDKNHATAMNNLGVLYDAGEGVARDSEQAARLLLDAYGRDDSYAKRNLEKQSSWLTAETRRAIQRLLKQDGFYDGGIDGRFGAGTSRALKSLATARHVTRFPQDADN